MIKHKILPIFLFFNLVIVLFFSAALPADENSDTVKQSGFLTAPGSIPLQQAQSSILVEVKSLESIDVNQGTIEFRDKSFSKQSLPKSIKSNIALSSEEKQKISAFISAKQQSEDTSDNKTLNWEKASLPIIEKEDTLGQPLQSKKLTVLENKRRGRKEKFEKSLERKASRKSLSKLSLTTMDETPSLSDSRVVVSPEYLVFHAVDGNSGSLRQTFKISNGGEEALNYTLSETSSWFDADSSGGEIISQEDTITITVNSMGLLIADSPYIEDIVITNNGVVDDVKKVRVRLSILAADDYVKTYSYDSEGNLVRRITPNGDVIEYAYDELNRLTHIYYPDAGSVSYEYDLNGRRLTMADKRGITNYLWDTFNRLIAVQYPLINPIYYEYDKTNRLTKIIYPNQEKVVYTYDAGGRMISVMDASGTTTYEYNNLTNNLIKKILPNGVYTEYEYDSAKRIILVSNKKSDNSLISKYQYEYDANNNRVKVIETTSEETKTINYIYDELNRLTRADYSDTTFESYTYDSAGNRLTKTTEKETINYKYDADNRLLRAGNTIFFYDKAGNLIKKVSPEKTEQYQYDYNNKLIQYSNGTDLITYKYDGDGNRVSKTVNGGKNNYINDINRLIVEVILEVSANWNVIKSYTYGLDRISQRKY
ncbi:MAG: hypothetical protein ABIH71_00360 [Candidatus Omnitrophota bacterium]|nr:hypothetical protein [Candidatus Omnitrophota bacterium]